MGKWQTQLDTTNETQEVSSFPAGDHKAHIFMSNENAPPTKMTIFLTTWKNFIFAIASYCIVAIP